MMFFWFNHVDSIVVGLIAFVNFINVRFFNKLTSDVDGVTHSMWFLISSWGLVESRLRLYALYLAMVVVFRDDLRSHCLITLHWCLHTILDTLMAEGRKVTRLLCQESILSRSTSWSWVLTFCSDVIKKDTILDNLPLFEIVVSPYNVHPITLLLCHGSMLLLLSPRL